MGAHELCGSLCSSSACAVLPGTGSSDAAQLKTQPLAPHLFLGMLSLSVPHSNHAQALYVRKDSARTQSKKWTDDGHAEDGISWHLKIWGIKQCPREAADACCEPKWGENFIPYIKTFPTGHTVLIAYLHISFSDYQWNIFSMYVVTWKIPLSASLTAPVTEWLFCFFPNCLLKKGGETFNDRVSEVTVFCSHKVTVKWSTAFFAFLLDVT